ncbi:MAG: carbon storage regulator [Halioglobus sp.]|nr:carbon storage regulator [Halioglobus sp.]
MLIISRKDAESILIRPAEDVDPAMTLADLFREGPIEITVFSAGSNRVKMGVQAPNQLSIWRKDAPKAIAV